MPGPQDYDFTAKVEAHALDLSPRNLETLQVNITKLCNQACHHCHVDSSPKRTEQMSLENVDRCLAILKASPQIKNLDLTGGAPELNPYFDFFVREARKLDRHVMVRHNLTVTLDGNPQTKESKEYLPTFFAENRVEVVSSLPYFQEFFTDKQRGPRVFEKSMESLKRLNREGYGQEGTGLILNLVYNPVGAYLPPAQAALEAQYKKELTTKFGITFNSLFTITNMPIHRMKAQLLKSGGYDDYMARLVSAFNPEAARNIMCRSMISVSYDGRLYDCDFNQMLNLPIQIGGQEATLSNWETQALEERQIIFASHCFGCTAGSGSSCGGQMT